MLEHRIERANGFIHEELTRALERDVKDPRAKKMAITGVDVTPDRRIARVYVSCYSGEEDLEDGLAGLESAKGYLRHRLSQVLQWRFTPHIEFRVDRSWEYGEKMDALFEQVEQERNAREGHDDTE